MRRPDAAAAIPPDAPRDCGLCPRLVAYRRRNAAAEPGWFNGAVPSFGDPEARLLIIGLAPGRLGANRTGRPFTGDAAGESLYAALAAHGFSTGRFEGRADDGLVLRGAMIANAVNCLPPDNKPTAAETRACRPFLKARIESLKRLEALLCLGKIAHDSALRALGAAPKDAPFRHGARIAHAGLQIFDSYHCSRYNVRTKRLTPEMFDAVFARIRAALAVV